MTYTFNVPRIIKESVTQTKKHLCGNFLGKWLRSLRLGEPTVVTFNNQNLLPSTSGLGRNTFNVVGDIIPSQVRILSAVQNISLDKKT